LPTLFLALHFITLLLLLVTHANGEGQICGVGAHVNGSWTLNPTLGPDTKKSFYCCKTAGHGETDPVCALLPEAAAEEDVFKARNIQTGSHLRTSNDCCACDLHEGGKNVINSVDSFVWQPDACTLPPWDADAFCTLLGPRTVLFLGDSTLAQTAYTLHEMVASNSTDGRCAKQVIFISVRRGSAEARRLTSTQHSYQVTFGRTDRLHPPDHEYGFRSMPEYVLQERPHVVVMGAGPHMADAAHMDHVLTQVRRRGRRRGLVTPS